ncbi:MAG TPA: dehydrogenase E1 component subunit alpha/beta [Sphaerochaeta sp.]|nr:dehydrogenase E1 component subunit alpha/beta [Sphaerochaeta sp.]HQB54415.1 dehydrogenase E1 component subunit alpha/beta [Sphaerochaeta sp.]
MRFTKDQAHKALSLMVRSRRFEELVAQFFHHKEMHGTTHLSIGQEAAQAGLSLALREGDWIVPTHRCHGHTIARGSDEEAMFSEMFGSRHGIAKGLGGSMHMADVQTWNAGSSSVVGSGVNLATGLGFALKRQESDSLSVAIFGDGASSRGSVHESMNLASVLGLPVLFFCENNGYGMSASRDKMVSASSIAKRAEGYGMPHDTVDGNDVEAVYAAVLAAAQYIRSNGKPYFLEVLTYRLCGHSKSDDCRYRTREEEAEWEAKDPISRFCRVLIKDELFSEEEVSEIILNGRKHVEEAALRARATRDDHLTLEEAQALVYAPEDPQTYGVVHRTIRSTYREAIRSALAEEMDHDGAVHLIGEDIGLYGGCFKVTGDLYAIYPDRIHETPVSEEAITGMGVGASFLGIRSVVEIMYGDFATLASDPIINHAAKAHFISAGQLSAPIVVRAPIGSGTGHGAQHTQSLESMFTNVPGLIVVAPSCPGDAKALLKSAIRSNNPVLFFEHKGLYDTIGPVGDKEYLMPLGKAVVKKRGSDVTIVAYSKAVTTVLAAASILSAQDEIEVEIIDLATLKPLDAETILRSVRKTGRLLVIHDSPEFAGFGAEILALTTSDESAFHSLKTVPKRLCGKEMPIPFAYELEKSVVVSKEEIVRSVRSLFTIA